MVEVSTAICLANGLTDYDVLITAVDESGASTQLAIGIPSPLVEDIVPVVTPDAEEEGGALPSISFLATLSMLGAAMLLQRRRLD